MTEEQILDEHPDLEKADFQAVYQFAAEAGRRANLFEPASRRESFPAAYASPSIPVPRPDHKSPSGRSMSAGAPRSIVAAPRRRHGTRLRVPSLLPRQTNEQRHRPNLQAHPGRRPHGVQSIERAAHQGRRAPEEASGKEAGQQETFLTSSSRVLRGEVEA
jgi:hypothetical protein